MSDELEGLQARKPEPPKIKAGDNPWYLLATLYGVPTPRDASLVQAKNRVAWNRYFAANLNDETRARLIEEKRYSAEELRTFSSGELQEVATAFAERRKAAMKDFALPASGAEIDFANIRFEQYAWFKGFLFSKPSSFHSATFSEGASFDDANFLDGARFVGATFYGAGFSGVTFALWAHFEGATFSRGAYFNGTTFSGGADFNGASFSGPFATSFDGAAFGGRTYFNCTTFSAGANFKGATFSREAYFSGATFSGWASFDGAAFAGKAYFTGATFPGKAHLTGATFSGGAYFDGATFSGSTTFSQAEFDEATKFINVEMKGETTFEGATFLMEPPHFFGAKLHQGTVWRGITWPSKPKDKSEAGRFIDAYACLKLEMDRLKKHEDELDFFALELRARGVSLGTSLGTWSIQSWVITAYGLLSDYGRSYVRPLIALFVIAVIGAGAFWRSDARTFGEAIGLSAANTLNVFGFRRDFGLAIDTPLAWLQVLAAAQTVLGTILLFLVGLGIRNKIPDEIAVPLLLTPSPPGVRSVLRQPLAPAVVRILIGDGRMAGAIRSSPRNLLSAAITEVGLSGVADRPVAHRFPQVHNCDRIGHRYNNFPGPLRRGNVDHEGVQNKRCVADNVRARRVTLGGAARRLMDSGRSWNISGYNFRAAAR
jgi:uncharacterized protein YjbI with pentapeptide repeats